MAERIEAGARVYATALYEAAVDAGRSTRSTATLPRSPNCSTAASSCGGRCSNPQLPHEAKKRVIEALMADADPLARNALMVLVDNGRLAFLHDIQVAFARDVRGRGADPRRRGDLGRAARSGGGRPLQERISSATGLTARLSPSVDPSIIGGLVLRARGVLLDASVKRELDDLRLALTTTPLPTGSEA